MAETYQSTGLADLSALGTNLTRISTELAELLGGPLVPRASVNELAAAKNQIEQFKQSVDQHVNESFYRIDEEQERLQHLDTPSLSTREPSQLSEDESASGFYNGAATFGLAQTKDRFVPTIYDMLDDFPECNELGYCKVRVDKDVRRDVDYKRMSGCTISALAGEQSAAVVLEEWGGRDELYGMACSVFVTPKNDGDLLSEFTFPDMQATETEAETAKLDGRQLFCSTVEGASSSSEKPYLVIPTEYTPAWRKSAGLPLQPYVDCGRQLSRTIGKVAGVHTPYEYVSSVACSATGMHVEDAYLGSANMVLAGAPKVWLIVPPEFLEELEARVKKELTDGVRPARPCSQFVRHMDALLSPKLLEKWEIPYHITSCKAGEMVVTLPGAYHQVVNAGPNYAQAINFAMSNWSGPPKSYRFCGNRCPQEDPPTATHFQIQEEDREGEDEEQEKEKEDEEQEDEIEEEEVGEGEEEKKGEEEEEVEEEEEGEEGEEEEEEDEEDEEDEEEEVGRANQPNLKRKEELEKKKKRQSKKRKSNRIEQQNEGARVQDKSQRQRRTEERLDAQQDDAQLVRSDTALSLSNSLVRQCFSDKEADATKLKTTQDLFHHIVTELGNPRKRHISPVVDDDDDDDKDDDGINSKRSDSSKSNRPSKIQVTGSTASNKIALRLSRPTPRSEVDTWKECVFRTAQYGGFNAEAVVQALQNAPRDQPVAKVLRTLQCLCEVANIAWLLQIRVRLLSDPAAARLVTAPAIQNQDHDVGRLASLHHSISILRTVSWVAQYELIVQQLQYYQQFEAIVKRRRAEIKRETDNRRNQRKRLGGRALDNSNPRPPPPVQVEPNLKRELILLMVAQGTSERAAKEDFEKYLKRGKTIHQLLGPASPSLLSLFPLYDTKEKPPCLNLMSHEPPMDISELDKRELFKPIDAACLFKLNPILATYFGQQLFIARPELKDYWRGKGSSSSPASTLCLTVVPEEKVASTKPTDVARLFESMERQA